MQYQENIHTLLPPPILYLLGLVRGGHPAELFSCLPLCVVWGQSSPWDKRERRYTYVPLAVKPVLSTTLTAFLLQDTCLLQRLSDHCSNHFCQGGYFVEQSNLVPTAQVSFSNSLPINYTGAMYSSTWRHYALTTLVRWLLSKEQTSLVFICQLFSSGDLPIHWTMYTGAYYHRYLLFCCRMCCHGNQWHTCSWWTVLVSSLWSPRLSWWCLLQGQQRGGADGQMCINRNQSSASRHTVA